MFSGGTRRDQRAESVREFLADDLFRVDNVDRLDWNSVGISADETINGHRANSLLGSVGGINTASEHSTGAVGVCGHDRKNRGVHLINREQAVAKIEALVRVSESGSDEVADSALGDVCSRVGKHESLGIKVNERVA